MKLHGCIPWSGPMFPIVLLICMNYVPLAAILNLQIAIFLIFLLNFSDTIWPIDMGLSYN